ncbi:MAG: rhomboid family intramembrane serine protease [Candidatus Nanohaloarchaea archaeon]
MSRSMTEESFNFAALQLTAVLGIIYAVQVFTGFDPAFNASQSPWWKFFTSIIGHSGMEHLFNNAFFIALFGSIYERFTSGKIFLATFFAAAFIANISAFIFFPASAIIGASGGAMGVLSALAVYRPNRIGLALGVPAPMWAVLLSYIFINFAGIPAATGVAYEAHLLGMQAGVPIGFHMRDRPYLKEDEVREEDEWHRKIREWEEKWML